jgi:N-acetylmuramoyl-L-alanine amidase
MKTVVIDPGHGGHDSGCIGSSSYEKHVALAVSLKLGELSDKHFPGIRVIYTRKTDVFVELHERAAIANRAHADLFICIHCNSGPSAAFGAETYVMGLHKTADNLSVAKRENSSILLEKDYKANYDGFDPSSPEANIIFSLFQNTFMNQSLEFASLIQDQFENRAGRFNRGVKQAGFLVLYKTTMPSVLIELGFLTNREDEKFLKSESGQDQMAVSILNAFKQYKGRLENKAGDSDQLVDIKEDRPESKPLEVKDTSGSVVQSSAVVVPPPPVFLTVQLGAVSTKQAGADKKFKAVPDVRSIIGDDGLTRFYSGIYTDPTEARKSLERHKTNGFQDAFLVAFSGPRKITVTEAVQLLNNKPGP